MLPAQSKVTKKITKCDSDTGEKIVKIIKTDNDSTLHVIIKKDGDEKEYKMALTGDPESQNELQEMLTKLDIDLDMLKHKPYFEHFHKTEPSGWLGVQIQGLSDQLRTYFKVKGEGGVLISEVVEDSPAAESGLKAGDIIITVDDEEIDDTRTLTKAIRSYDPEEEITVKYIRNGKTKSATVRLGEYDSPHHMSWYKSDLDHDFMPSHDKALEKFIFAKPGFDDHELMYRFDTNADLEKEVQQLKQELEELKEELEKLK